MSKLIDKIRGRAATKTRPGGVSGAAGSRAITGISPGDAGSNTGGGANRRPGRRRADTPLGPGQNRL